MPVRVHRCQMRTNNQPPSLLYYGQGSSHSRPGQIKKRVDLILNPLARQLRSHLTNSSSLFKHAVCPGQSCQLRYCTMDSKPGNFS